METPLRGVKFIDKGSGTSCLSAVVGLVLNPLFPDVWGEDFGGERQLMYRREKDLPGRNVLVSGAFI